MTGTQSASPALTASCSSAVRPGLTSSCPSRYPGAAKSIRPSPAVTATGTETGTAAAAQARTATANVTHKSALRRLMTARRSACR